MARTGLMKKHGRQYIKNLQPHEHTKLSRALLKKVLENEAREALEIQKQVNKDEVLKAIMQAANLDTDISQIHLVKDFIINTLEEKLQISNKLEELTKQYEELKSSYKQIELSLNESQVNYQACQKNLLSGDLNHNEELEL